MFTDARFSASRSHGLVRNSWGGLKDGLNRTVDSKEMVHLWSRVALKDRERPVDYLVPLRRAGKKTAPPSPTKKVELVGPVSQILETHWVF